jgi:general secretion pathway protein E
MVKETSIDIALIKKAKMLSSKEGKKAMEILEDLVGLPSDPFIQNLASILSYPSMTLEAIKKYEPDFALLSFSDCLRQECVLVKNDKDYHLIFADIYNENFQDWANEHISAAFTMTLAHASDIAAYLAQHEENIHTSDFTTPLMNPQYQKDLNQEELSINIIEGDVSPAVKLVRSTLYDALKMDASDIHLEMIPSGLSIKYRLDGVLSKVGTINEMALAEQIISRVKVMAELDITEQRVPQDGRFRATYQKRDIDFRVSVMPSIHGEDIVIRVLDKQTLADEVQGLRLDLLGFDTHTIEMMRAQFQLPYGMILVTGPTGSGKTTTLYAAVSEINHGFNKIITIEDPIEYQLNGVLQIPVNEKKGLTFARGLRSILRHDPDQIMVGEIRDNETAQIAVQSALTGHLVFTTVHANNAFDVIGRFLNMGVDAYSFVSALNIVVAQRLLRLVCPQCATPFDASASSYSGIPLPPDAKLLHGKGCGSCRGTGYKGRKAIAEVVVFNDELRELIVNQASIRQIKAYAQQHGTRVLHEVALDMAFKGDTTLEEVYRVAPSI